MWNNSANKLFDALASITPVAINYGGWQKSFIEKNHCGLVLSDLDFVQSCKAISTFLKDERQYDEATENCRHLAYNEFSRDNVAQRIEKALLEVLHD